MGVIKALARRAASSNVGYTFSKLSPVRKMIKPTPPMVRGSSALIISLVNKLMVNCNFDLFNEFANYADKFYSVICIVVYE